MGALFERCCSSRDEPDLFSVRDPIEHDKSLSAREKISILKATTHPEAPSQSVSSEDSGHVRKDLHPQASVEDVPLTREQQPQGSVKIFETVEEIRYRTDSDLGLSPEQMQNFNFVVFKLRTLTASSCGDKTPRSDSDFGLSDEQLKDFNWTVRKIRALTSGDDMSRADSDFGLSDQQLDDFNWTSNKLRALTAFEDEPMSQSDSEFGLSDDQLQNFNWVVHKLRAMTETSDSGDSICSDSIFGLSDEQLEGLITKLARKPTDAAEVEPSVSHVGHAEKSLLPEDSQTKIETTPVEGGVE